MYCTYIRFQGIFGWLNGWFLVGISNEKRISGYVADFANFGIYIMLLEMKPPLPPNFWFIPKGAKKLKRVFLGTLKSTSG